MNMFNYKMNEQTADIRFPISKSMNKEDLIPGSNIHSGNIDVTKQAHSKSSDSSLEIKPEKTYLASAMLTEDTTW